MGIKKTLTALVTAAALALGNGCSKEDDPFYIPPPSTNCNISEYDLSLYTQQTLNQLAATGTYNLNNWELSMVNDILWDFKAGTPEFFGYLYLIDGGSRDGTEASVVHKTMLVNRDLIHMTYASGHLFARAKHGAEYGISYSRAQYESDMYALWVSLNTTIGGDIEIPYIPPTNPTLDAIGDFYWRQSLAAFLGHEAVHILNKHDKQRICAQYSGASPDFVTTLQIQNESEADKLSVDVLQKAYDVGRNIHPIGSLLLVEHFRIVALSGTTSPVHPPFEVRVATITAELAARGHPTDLWGNWPTPYTP